MDTDISHAVQAELDALNERVTALEQASGQTKPGNEENTEVDNTLPETDEPVAEPKYDPNEVV